jgi:hypothetical protein
MVVGAQRTAYFGTLPSGFFKSMIPLFRINLSFKLIFDLLQNWGVKFFETKKGFEVFMFGAVACLGVIKAHSFLNSQSKIF